MTASANTTLTNCTFSGNSATSGSGGGLFVDCAKGIHVIGTLFFNNSASSGGGAVAMERCALATVIEISHTTFMYVSI